MVSFHIRGMEVIISSNYEFDRHPRNVRSHVLKLKSKTPMEKEGKLYDVFMLDDLSEVFMLGNLDSTQSCNFL